MPSPNQPSGNPGEYQMPEMITEVPGFTSAAPAGEGVLSGPRETGVFTTPEGVTYDSHVAPDGMKQTRVHGQGMDQQAYNAQAGELSAKMAAHREAVANADPEYLKQFMPPEAGSASEVPAPAERPALITEAPLTDEQRAAMAERQAADEAARAEEQPKYGGYTGVRISQTPGAVDAMGRPTGPIVRPPTAE